jgi:hypothetical protein
MPLDDQWTYSRETIEALGDQWIDRTKAYGSYNTLFGEVTIPGIQGLKYRINLGGNFRMSNGGSYTGEGVFSNNATTPSTATVSNSLTTNWAVENLLTYERTFAEKHQVNAVECTLQNRQCTTGHRCLPRAFPLMPSSISTWAMQQEKKQSTRTTGLPGERAHVMDGQGYVLV